MARVFISLGSNLGDRAAFLRLAVRGMRGIGNVVAVSSLYETTPVGYLDQPDFLNAVVALETTLPPQAVLAALRVLEDAAGRQRPFPNAPRTLDLDLVLYDEVVMQTPELTLPHPRFHERAFVLVPLAELAPAVRHPVLGKTVAELLDALGDVHHAVRKVAGPAWADTPTENA
ncbi:MAG: 2-amino-4-hydroxy-6-hydroxymethyldihydropteridine diphosphokinase [Thermorudis peleae]|nr:2-amino-4-hydroxy-6-hydroxymethyldihydropteridine diphosphokinase [Thermorudis peleae]